MKRMWSMAMVAAMVLSPVLGTQAQEAGGGAKPKGEHKQPALTDMTVSGTVSKEDRTNPNGKTFSHYVLTEASGAKVMLPGGEPHARPGATAPATTFKLEEFVGKDVTITGKGFTMEREGKKITRLAEITKIDVTVPAAAPAATPAAAPAAAPATK